jgi:hypothetical protein
MAYGNVPLGSGAYGGGQPPTRREINDLIIEQLKVKQGISPRCPICENREFAVGDFVPVATAPNPLGGYTTPLGAPNVLPCVAVTCQRCGNTLFVNLLVLGFTETILRAWGYPLLG